MSLKNILIRPETGADFKSVFEVNAAAFKQENESHLVDALRKSDAFIPGLSLVAEINNRVTGHILFTRIHIQGVNIRTESIALAPVAVLPEFQNQGIGAALIRKGLELATALNHPSVIVLGHDTYYPKFGFVPASKWQIKAPFDVPDAAFMALELVPGSLQNAAGTVVYPDAFNAV